MDASKDCDGHCSLEKAISSVDGRQKQQQRYISKLKRLSKELAALPSSSTKQNEVPAKSESLQSELDKSTNHHETITKQVKEERQIRSYQKLKELINELERESPKSSPQKTAQPTAKCVTPESIRHEASILKLKSTEPSEKKNSFNLQELLRCCGEMNMEDMLNTDDDFDQLIDLKSLDDTTLGDWTIEDTIRTGLTEREIDTTNTTYHSEYSDFFRGEPCEILWWNRYNIRLDVATY